MPTLRRIRLKSGWVYQLDYRENGKRCRPLVGSDKKTAEQKLARVIRALEKDEPVRLAPGPTFREAAKTYLDRCHNAPKWHRQKKQILRDLGKEWNRLPLSAITTERIEVWAGKKGKGTTGSTANRYIAVISHLLHQARRWGWIQHVPDIQKLKETGPSQDYLSPDEFKAIMVASEPEYRPLWLFLVATGLRIGEALTIQREDLKDGVLRVRNEKAGRVELLPLPPPVVRHLEAQGERPFPWTYWHIRGIWRRARTAAKLPQAKIKDLRSSTGSWMIQAGVPLRVVQDTLRHKSPTTTARHYAHLEHTQVRAALEGVSGQLVNYWSIGPGEQDGENEPSP